MPNALNRIAAFGRIAWGKVYIIQKLSDQRQNSLITMRLIKQTAPGLDQLIYVRALS